ncbi:MAG: helix-turn-helix domain-containing protein, partial [Pseudomonadota bacterium]
FFARLDAWWLSRPPPAKVSDSQDKTASEGLSMMSIGQLSERSGVKVTTIRYYEKSGLIPAAPRNSGNQRRYGQAHLDQLRFIRHARDLGFDMDAIRALLEMSATPQASCHAADNIAQTHLASIKERIAQLTLLQTELERMIDACQHGRICDCRVIEVLADHAECSTDHGRIGSVSAREGKVG